MFEARGGAWLRLSRAAELDQVEKGSGLITVKGFIKPDGAPLCSKSLHYSRITARLSVNTPPSVITPRYTVFFLSPCFYCFIALFIYLFSGPVGMFEFLTSRSIILMVKGNIFASNTTIQESKVEEDGDAS